MSNLDQDKNGQAKQAEGNEFDIAESSYKTTHTAVRKARRFAMQGLYEWLMTDRRFAQSGQETWQENAPHAIAARTRANNAMHTVHLGYYHELMRDIPTQIDELQSLINKHLDRDINLLDPIEHAILLVGTYELKNSLHIPYKVVLDEAMKLNTHFGATDAHKLINAVLDKLAPELRQLEVEDIRAGSKADAKAGGKVDQQDLQQKQKQDSDTADISAKNQRTPIAEGEDESHLKNKTNTARAEHTTIANTTIANATIANATTANTTTANTTTENTKPRIGRHANKKGAPVKRNAKLGASSNHTKVPNTSNTPAND